MNMDNQLDTFISARNVKSIDRKVNRYKLNPWLTVHKEATSVKLTNGWQNDRIV